VNAANWKVYVLPTALILLMAGAGIVYLCARQWWRAAYWFSGAMLNVAVTFGF
jgi:hypothetical protein